MPCRLQNSSSPTKYWARVTAVNQNPNHYIVRELPRLCLIINCSGPNFSKRWCTISIHHFTSLIFYLTIFKVFIEFTTILLLWFMFWFFGHKACGILVSQSEIEPAPPALESKVLPTGQPGKSLSHDFLLNYNFSADPLSFLGFSSLEA